MIDVRSVRRDLKSYKFQTSLCIQRQLRLKTFLQISADEASPFPFKQYRMDNQINVNLLQHFSRE